MSQNEYFLTAESMPAAMPKIASITRAKSANLRVLGNFCNRMLLTGRFS